MKLEAGKYYMTRDGRKVGPMVARDMNWGSGLHTKFWSYIGGAYFDDGSHYSKEENDIIAEWNTVIKEIEGFENTDPIPSSAFDPCAPITSMAALAAQHHIKITVHVGEVIFEYDGRD